VVLGGLHGLVVLDLGKDKKQTLVIVVLFVPVVFFFVVSPYI
jgi:hypothetical protein